MTDRWEHRYDKVIGYVADVHTHVNDLGAEGWELVQVSPFGIELGTDNTSAMVWMKRRL